MCEAQTYVTVVYFVSLVYCHVSCRYTEMFKMNDRPSLRFVRDAMRMRRTQPVELELLRDFITAAPLELPQPTEDTGDYPSSIRCVGSFLLLPVDRCENEEFCSAP
jgi:hypothetical protein